MTGKMIESVTGADGMDGGVVKNSAYRESDYAPWFMFHAKHSEPRAGLRDKAQRYLERVVALRSEIGSGRSGALLSLMEEMDDLMAEFLSLQEVVWENDFHNVVTIVGKNDLLDKYLAGSAYTATWYMGLISSVSWSAVSENDTMSSHSGWTEAGGTNAPNYTATPSRGELTSWNAASAKSKSTNTAEPFSITQNGTVKGAFINSVQTKDGSTGTLYSAGTFSGGDRTVQNGDTLNVSGTWSFT